MVPPVSPSSPRPSLRRRLLVSALTFLLLTAGAEVAARVGGWLYYGRNPYYLYYGFVSWTDEQGEGHSDKRGGYFKFPADRDITYGLPGGAHINNHGFRGPDFEAVKPPGVFRVACLGGSSTFGFHDPDDGTYPHFLGTLCAERADPRVEVLNFGVPHQNTDHIRALFEAEILGFAPDVATIYVGFNDATFPLAGTRAQRVSRWLDEYSAAYASLRKVLNAVVGPVVFYRWAEYKAEVPRAEVERQLALHLERTGDNVAAILDAAREHGVATILVRQPMTTWYRREELGLSEGPRPPYEEEYALTAARLERDGVLHDFEVPLYVHHHLQELLATLAAERGAPVVDNVTLVDERPEGLLTMVHLDVEANRRLAAALYLELERLLSGH